MAMKRFHRAANERRRRRFGASRRDSPKTERQPEAKPEQVPQRKK